MSIIAMKKKGEYSKAPEGLWPAVCCDVVDLGLQKSQFGEAYKIEIRWMLGADEDPGLDPKSGRPYMVTNRYTLSLHEKSRLRPMLEAWRGRKFSVEELEGFDLEKLIGANCQVQVVHNVAAEGEVYANVQAVVPAARNAVKLRVNGDYVRVCEREKRRELEQNPHQEGGYKATDQDCPF